MKLTMQDSMNFPGEQNNSLYLNAALQTIIAQASERGDCKYSDVDLPAEKRARASVEWVRQRMCGARTSVECSSAQGFSGARTSAECRVEHRQASEQFSDSTSTTKPYGISEVKD